MWVFVYTFYMHVEIVNEQERGKQRTRETDRKREMKREINILIKIERAKETVGKRE